ncbi:hypothetical protein K788_0005840 [Paraburkholderia caribensis MBA4]|uniref:Uncharacterized protein n=1 Tax=Paraburkholderia caribensis MBA4 TaxID=1323664 RepID=A0A0N7JT69_9BURK|nr:hypothetical protein K788_0005840 [Paraburkholderia caribensis MBA4]
MFIYKFTDLRCRRASVAAEGRKAPRKRKTPGAWPGVSYVRK